MNMDVNAYIDEALNEEDLDVYINKLKDTFELEWKKENKKETFPERQFSNFKDTLIRMVRFKKQFNVDDYVEAYKLNDESNTLPEFIKDLRNDILDDFSRKEYAQFIRTLKNKATEITEEVGPVQSAINTSFTINGKPMTIADLRNANDAIPVYSVTDYDRKLIRLRQLLPYERRNIIPDGSIKILIDKFEAEKEVTESVAVTPDINLKGFFNSSGLFSGINADEREVMYAYWEGIHKKEFKAFKETMKDFVNDNESLRTSWDKFLSIGQDEENKGSYIIPINKKTQHLPDIFDSVNLFIREYLLKAGVLDRPSRKETGGYSKPTEKGQKPDSSTAIGETEEVKSIEDDIDYILEGGLDVMELDPILLAQYNSNKQPILFKESDLDNARRHIKRRGRKMTLSKEMLKSMDKYFDALVDEIKVAKSDDDGIFYLPITNQIHDKNEVFEIDEAYSEFLAKVAEILVGESSYGTSGGYRGTGRKDSPFSVTQTPIAPKIKPTQELSGSAEKVVKVIGDYIIKPINSGKYFGDVPKFTTQSWFTSLNTYIRDDPYSKTLSHALDKFNPSPSELDNITDMLKLMVRRSDVSINNPEIYIKSGVNALNSLLGDDKQNKELGGYIWYLFKKDAKLGGVSVESLHEDYKNNSRGRVFQMLTKLLNSYEFRRRLLIRDVGKREVRGVATNTVPITRLRTSWVHKDNEELLKSAQHLLNLLEDEEKSIMASFNLIMEAHDMIRKMSNKNIVYHHLSLDDIDSVDYILKQVPTYDLNILDLQQIVTDLDSFSNIAKAFGINEEAVYTIKGLCRGIY